MTMLMKQLKLHINFHYKAILIFWILALLIKGALNAAHLNGLKIGLIYPKLSINPSIAIMMFIIGSTFIIQDDLFRLAISFGVTRIQYLSERFVILYCNPHYFHFFK